MWKKQGSWNFFHAKLIPNSSIDTTNVNRKTKKAVSPLSREQIKRKLKTM